MRYPYIIIALILITTLPAVADELPSPTPYEPMTIPSATANISQASRGETTLLALIIGSMAALVYVGYTGTDMSRRGTLPD